MSKSYCSPTLSLLAGREGTIPIQELVEIPISILSSKDIPMEVKNKQDKDNERRYYWRSNEREKHSRVLEDIIDKSILSAKTNGQRYYCLVNKDFTCDLLAAHMIDKIDNRYQQILMVLDCELLPLTISAGASGNQGLNLLVVFDVIVSTIHNTRRGGSGYGSQKRMNNNTDNLNVEEKLTLLRSILWDGRCKRCHCCYDDKKDTGHSHGRCCDDIGLQCDYGLKLQHPKFQHVVTKRCFELKDFQLSHYEVLTNTDNNKQQSLAHFYDGMILESKSVENSYSYKFKRGQSATLDVLIVAKPAGSSLLSDRSGGYYDVDADPYGEYDDDGYDYGYDSDSARRPKPVANKAQPAGSLPSNVVYGYLVSAEHGYSKTKYPIVLPTDKDVGHYFGMVVECTFEQNASVDSDGYQGTCWKFVRERVDKTIPNNANHERRIELQCKGQSMKKIITDLQMKLYCVDDASVESAIDLNPTASQQFFELSKKLAGVDATDDANKAKDLVPVEENHRSVVNDNDGRDVGFDSDCEYDRYNNYDDDHYYRVGNVDDHEDNDKGDKKEEQTEVAPIEEANHHFAFGELCWIASGKLEEDEFLLLEQWEERMKTWSTPINTTSSSSELAKHHQESNLTQYEAAVKTLLACCFEQGNTDTIATKGSSVVHIKNDASTLDVKNVEEKTMSPPKAVFVHSLSNICESESTINDFLVNTVDKLLTNPDGYLVCFTSIEGANDDDTKMTMKPSLSNDCPFYQTLSKHGYVLKRIIPLQQFVHFVSAGYDDHETHQATIHFIDHMSKDELETLKTRYCLILQKKLVPMTTSSITTTSSVTVAANDQNGTTPSAVTRASSDGFRCLFGNVDVHQDAILHILSYLNVKSHFILARTNKQMLRSYLIGFDYPMMNPSQLTNAIVGFGNLRLFQPAAASKANRYVGKYLNSSTLNSLAQTAPCIHGCFYCQCQGIDLRAHKTDGRQHHCFCIKCMLQAPHIFDDLTCGYRSAGNSDIDSIDAGFIWNYHDCDSESKFQSHYFHRHVRPKFMNIFILKSLFLSNANMLPSVVTSTTNDPIVEQQDFLDALCPELFSSNTWKDSKKLHRLNEIRQELDEHFYLPLLAYQYLLPGAMEFERSFYSTTIRNGDCFERAKTRWETIRKEHETWRERWIVLRTTSIFKREHGGMSDRSYGDVTDCSPFATIVF